MTLALVVTAPPLPDNPEKEVVMLKSVLSAVLLLTGCGLLLLLN